MQPKLDDMLTWKENWSGYGSVKIPIENALKADVIFNLFTDFTDHQDLFPSACGNCMQVEFGLYDINNNQVLYTEIYIERTKLGMLCHNIITDEYIFEKDYELNDQYSILKDFLVIYNKSRQTHGKLRKYYGFYA